MDIAREKGHTECVALLVAAIAATPANKAADDAAAKKATDDAATSAPKKANDDAAAAAAKKVADDAAVVTAKKAADDAAVVAAKKNSELYIWLAGILSGKISLHDRSFDLICSFWSNHQRHSSSSSSSVIINRYALVIRFY